MSKHKQAQDIQKTKQKTVTPPKQKMQMGKTAVIPSPIPALQRAYTDHNTLTSAEAQSLQSTIAKQVVGKLHASPSKTAPAETTQRQEEEELQMKPLIQRQEEEELQMKPLPSISSLQRQEEEDLQMKPQVQRQEEEEIQAKGNPMLAGGELRGDVESSVQSAKYSGQPMSDNIRTPMEQAFNADFSNIKIHTGGQTDTLNRSLSTRAFTSEQDIFFRSGEYNPNNLAGKELLAHELTHTVQ